MKKIALGLAAVWLLSCNVSGPQSEPDANVEELAARKHFREFAKFRQAGGK